MTPLPLLVVALLTSLALGRFGAGVTRGLHPAAAVRLLTASTVATALATGFIMCVTAFTAWAQLPAAAALGHWSATSLTAHDDVPLAIGAVVAAIVVGLLVRAAQYVATAVADLVTAELACRRLGPGTDALVVVDDARPDAYVMPGVHGRIVVSTAMLRALPADERRALLAHEAAHLRHRHHLYIQLTQLSARANPLLHPLVDVVCTGVERWADEEAAAAIGSRGTTARAIARAALAQHGAATHARAHNLALGVAGTPTMQRTYALLAAPAPHRIAPTLALTALMAAGPLAAIATALITERYFELAQAALRSR